MANNSIYAGIRECFDKAKRDTKGFAAWRREVPVATVSGVLAWILLPEQEVMNEWLAIFAVVLASVIVVPLLELLWNFIAAPLRIEREKHDNTKRALEAARKGVFSEECGDALGGTPWFLRYTFTENECKKIPMGDGVYFQFPYRQGATPTITWPSNDAMDDYQIDPRWDRDGVLIQRKNPDAQPVNELQLGFSGAHSDEADLIQKKLGFEVGFDGYHKMTRFIDQCLRDPDRGWAYLIDRAKKVDDVTR